MAADRTQAGGIAQSAVAARIGLLGNPSDGYGGRVVGCTIAEIGAVVSARPADRWVLSGEQRVDAPDVSQLRALLASDGGSELLAAAVLALVEHDPSVADHPCSLSFTTTIPRQVGLSGSSAIIIGAVEAIAALGNIDLDPLHVARIALEAETTVLGWTAGPQDRIVQSLGGLLDMRFSDPWIPTSHRQLDPRALPPLVLAWNAEQGEPSTVVHRDVRSRYDAGDREVVEAMTAFADLAETGVDAMHRGAAGVVWPDLLNQAWTLRTCLFALSETDQHMVELAQACGGGASIAGSGGAVVAAAPDDASLRAICRSFESSGVSYVVPTVSERT